MKNANGKKDMGMTWPMYDQGDLAPEDTAKHGQSDDGVNYMANKGEILTSQTTNADPVKMAKGKNEAMQKDKLWGMADNHEEFYRF